MARFNLLHLVSDWFRNAQFRDRFRSQSTIADQLKILRAEYGLDDSEMRVMTTIDREGLKKLVGDMVIEGDADRPEMWEGVTSAVTYGTNLGPAPVTTASSGWPGDPWVCLESVSPVSAPAGAQVTLTMLGWNLPAGLEFVLASLGQTPVGLTVRRSEVDGRVTITADVTLPNVKAEWDITFVGGGTPGSLTRGFTTT